MEPYFEQEHPIPQQISAYEFHLVGDMTLKQFFQVAAGALISIVLYGSSLSAYVKWPLIIMFFLGGVAFAFFPLQDRPLSVWVTLFLKAIYSPTKYAWKKAAKKPQFFQPEPTAQMQTTQLPQPEDVDTDLIKHNVTFPAHPDESQTEETQDDAQAKKDIKPLKLPQEETVQKKPTPSEIRIPQKQKVQVDHHEKDIYKEKSDVAPEQVQTPTTVTPIMGSKIQGGQQAQFSIEASPPTPPTRPNVVVGQVMDPQGKIVEGAILEIKDDEGRPARALKTNKLGHFLIVTPLVDGKYTILTEKEGLHFEPINILAEGKIIQPIAIWAKENGELLQEKVVKQNTN